VINIKSFWLLLFGLGLCYGYSQNHLFVLKEVVILKIIRAKPLTTAQSQGRFQA